MARLKRSAEKEQFWRSMVEEQGQGSLNVRAFCGQKGISEPSFYSWRKELQKRDAEEAVDVGNGPRTKSVAAGESSGQLIPVEVVGARCEHAHATYHQQSKLPLEIGTPGGFTLRFDPHTTPETISRLLEVISRCSTPGASSC